MSRCLALLLLACAGCLTFNDRRVPVGDPVLVDAAPTVACAAERFARTYNGVAAGSRPLLDDQTASRWIAEQICRLWTQDGLVSQWGTPAELGNADYTLTLRGAFRESGSMLASRLTALTLFLVPSTWNVEVDIRATLVEDGSGRRYQASSANSWSTWRHLVFLPAFPLSGLGILHAQRDQARHLYEQLRAKGAFEPVASR